MKNKLLIATLLTSMWGNSQHEHRCGTPSASEYLQLHPSITEDQEALENFTRQFTQEKTGSIIIPVVFHVNDPTNPQKVTVAQVQSALDILNEDFNAANPGFSSIRPEFSGIASNIGITFCLATKDPNGQTTTGITYHYNNFDGESPDYTGSDVKSVSYWSGNKYLNIWIVNRPYDNDTYSSGWAYKPSNWTYSDQIDGIVYNHRYLGYTGSSDVTGPNDWQQEMAHVLTHEVGHYLNLDHTFEGYCSEPNDNVTDTPPVYYYGSTNCEQIGTKCSGVNLVNDENYMDYTYCPSMFTNGQKTRMLAALNSTVGYRNNLWSESNLIAVGCASTSGGSSTISEINDAPFNLIVSPNPSNGIFSIETNNMTCNYTLIVKNALDQVIYSTNNIDPNVQKQIIDLSMHKSGMYFIELKTESHSIIQKMIKTN